MATKTTKKATKAKKTAAPKRKGAKEPIAKRLARLRAEYATIMRRSLAKSSEDFTAMVSGMLFVTLGLESPTPEDYVAAARTVSFPCDRCGGTGLYVTGMLNGRPVTPGGDCFRCAGKGRQNDADVTRNNAYDEIAFAREARRMVRGE